jgi:hypothetical protein
MVEMYQILIENHPVEANPTILVMALEKGQTKSPSKLRSHTIMKIMWRKSPGSVRCLLHRELLKNRNQNRKSNKDHNSAQYTDMVNVQSRNKSPNQKSLNDHINEQTSDPYTELNSDPSKLNNVKNLLLRDLSNEKSSHDRDLSSEKSSHDKDLSRNRNQSKTPSKSPSPKLSSDHREKKNHEPVQSHLQYEPCQNLNRLLSNHQSKPLSRYKSKHPSRPQNRHKSKSLSQKLNKDPKSATNRDQSSENKKGHDKSQFLHMNQNQSKSPN